jgi:solute carrier family 25 carnitine/acylcarnitine transporter 20/29
MQEKLDIRDQVVGFLAGLASGITKLLVGHPFDTIKIRMQTEGSHGRFKGSWDCIRQTIGKEGLLACYKGATPPLIGWSIMDSVQMGSLTTYRMLLQDSKGNLTLLEHSLAGIGAGITVSFVASPIEIIKAKLQIQYDAKSKLYRGPIHCAQMLIKEDGLLKGLYRGMTGTLLFRSFFWVLWGSYEIYSQKLAALGIEKSMIPFFAGGLAANTFWTIAFPADVIKNRLMTRPKENPRYSNIVQCARYVYRKEGILGFYRGFVPCFLRSFPTNASAIFVFESCFAFGKGIGLKDKD